MVSVFLKSLKLYVETIDLITYSSIFILLSMILLPLVASYVNVGGALVRFSSFYMDITLLQFLVILFTSAVGMLLLSFFTAAVISIVKLKQTLDHFGFSRVMKSFKEYVFKVFWFFVIISIVSILIGVFFDFLGFDWVAQVFILLLWVLFLFTPQAIVIENFGLREAMLDSVNFLKRNFIHAVCYLVTGLVMLLVLAFLETALGQVFVWEHKVVSIVIMALFILPFLLIYGTELYLKRYPVSSF